MSDRDEAARQERSRVHDGSRELEIVREWNCGNDKCDRKDQPVSLPPQSLPDPCRGCGGEEFYSKGLKQRPKEATISCVCLLCAASGTSTWQWLCQQWGLFSES